MELYISQPYLSGQSFSRDAKNTILNTVRIQTLSQFSRF